MFQTHSGCYMENGLSLGSKNGSMETNEETSVVAQMGDESGWTGVVEKELGKVNGDVFWRFCYQDQLIDCGE